MINLDRSQETFKGFSKKGGYIDEKVPLKKGGFRRVVDSDRSRKTFKNLLNYQI